MKKNSALAVFILVTVTVVIWLFVGSPLPKTSESDGDGDSARLVGSVATLSPDHHEGEPVMIGDLSAAIRGHNGEFLCEQISDKKATKVVHFAHVVESPVDSSGAPELGRLREFYTALGGVLFYYDEKSGDAAKRIAPIAEWNTLQREFRQWVEYLDESERRELLPKWIDTALVVGETPHSGNYLLVPAEGEAAGHVFEFDHDGFEFKDKADSIVDYAAALLNPDSRRLTSFASHMRFVEGDARTQWWIKELKDNQGRVVATTP